MHSRNPGRSRCLGGGTGLPGTVLGELPGKADSGGPEDVTPLCSEGAENSLFVWSKDCITILKQRDYILQESQLLAISYLWEICHDLLLAKKDNVSFSPGFESLGLRVN